MSYEPKLLIPDISQIPYLEEISSSACVMNCLYVLFPLPVNTDIFVNFNTNELSDIWILRNKQKIQE